MGVVHEYLDITVHLTLYNATIAYILDVIQKSKENREKSICFVTGVPGAGKTLVGLDVAVIGIEKDGRLAILDPSYKEGKYLEEGRVGKVELKNGVITLCEIETLKQDTANRTPSYHLFWRK